MIEERETSVAATAKRGGRLGGSLQGISRTRKIVRDFGLLGASVYFAKLIALLTRFFLFRFLGPFQMGIWSFLALLVDWAEYFSLGVANAVTQKLPRALALGDQKEAASIRNRAFSFIFITSSLFSLTVLAVAWFLRPTLAPLLFGGLVLVCGFTFLQRHYELIRFTLNAYKKFEIAAKLNLICSLSIMGLTLLLAARFRLYGFLAALLIATLLGILIGFRHIPHFRFVPLRRDIVPFIATGLSLLGMEIIVSVFRTVDKLMISRFLGFDALGYYSLGQTVSTGIFMIPYVLRHVLFPHYQEQFIKRQRSFDMRNMVIRPLLVLSYLIPLAMTLAWLMVPVIVSHFVPSFTPAIAAFKTLLLGTFFLCLTQPLMAFLITIHRRKPLFLSAGLSVVLLVILQFFAVWMGFGIEGVALSTSLVFLLFFSILFYLASPHLVGAAESRLVYLKIISLFVMTLGVLGFSDFIGAVFLNNRILFSFAVAVLSWVAFFWVSRRHNELLHVVQDVIFRKGTSKETQTSPSLSNVLMVTPAVDVEDCFRGFVTDWIDAFARKTGRLTIVTSYARGYDPPANVEIVAAQPARDLNPFRRRFLLAVLLNRYLIQRRFDCIFVHMNPLFVLFAAPLAQIRRIPIILWYAHRKVTNRLRWAHRFCSRLITASEESLRLSTVKKNVIGHGIDTQRFVPSDAPCSTKERVLLSVCRMSPAKRCELILQAYGLLKSKNGDTPLKLIFVGDIAHPVDQPYFDGLREQVSKAGWGRDVEFRGGIRHRDIVPVYQACDLFINVSETGSIDKAVLEAMACGKLVLTSNEAFRSLLAPVSESLFIQDPSPASLAERIQSILAWEPSQQVEIGLQLRRLVVQRHSLDGLSKRLCEILGSLNGKNYR